MSSTSLSSTRPTRIPVVHGWVTAALMALASAIGILVPGVYRDLAWIEAAWAGSDVVTLVVAAPLMIAGLLLWRRGSRLGELLVCAMFAYSIYGYAYYLFGAALNVMLPLYVALVVVPLIGLAVALGRMDVGAVAVSFAERTPVRLVASYMLFTGVGLAIAWLAQWAAYIFGGTEPSVGPEAFKLVASLDLTLIVPFMALGGVLLWRRAPWGYVLGAIYTVKGATYTLVLTAGSIVGALRGVEGSAGQIPIWGVWTLLGAAAALLLLGGVRRTRVQRQLSST